MRSQIYIHRNNSVSFSYYKFNITKQGFQKYVLDQTPEEYKPLIQSDPYHYIHAVKSGVYQIDKGDHVYTLCSLQKLHDIYAKSDQLYYFLMKNLYLNTYLIRPPTLSFYGSVIQHVSTTFYPEDILEVNQEDYYKIYIRGLNKPLHLQTSAKLINESGESKPLLEILYRMGKRRVLGINTNLQLQEFEIERVQNVSHSDDHDHSIFNTPFYAIGFLKDPSQPSTILMDQILVELD